MVAPKADPIDIGVPQNAARIVVPASFKDKDTGALFIHQDLVKVQEPYAEEAHIAPMSGTVRLGNVESFVHFIQQYGDLATLLTWNSQGLHAVLDYAKSASEPGRGQWRAQYLFRPSRQWDAWLRLASGSAIDQRKAVEALEDMALDIVEPAQTDLANILRNLRSSVNAKADAELRPDGTSKISFAQDKAVKTPGDVDLPAGFKIAIPVLKGHLDDTEKPVVYIIDVRIRVAVDDNSAKLAFRFSIPNAEAVLEDCYSDRVQKAQVLLGEEYQLLRAAD